MSKHYLIFLLFVLTGCHPSLQMYDRDIPTLSHELPKFEPIEERMRVAVVLGGGGARGMAHVGVLEELEAAHIPIDLIVGCSAGGLVGALYAHNPFAADIKKELVSLRREDIIVVDLLTVCHGLGHGDGLKKFLMLHLGEAHFEDLWIPLVVVATDLCRGELVCFNSGPVAPTVHASCAIPFIFSPVRMYHSIFVDGGVIDPIPVEVARKHNVDVIIAVDISASLSPALPSNLFGVAKRCTEIQYIKQSEACSKSADIIIRPEIGHISAFDDESKDELYRAGRAAARAAIPSILAALKKS